MKSLYWRVWLTVVAVLALFALGSGWMFQREIEEQRGRFDALANERLAAWGELIQRSLPGPEAAPQEQVDALIDWSHRLRVPLALDDRAGKRLGASPMFERLQRELVFGDDDDRAGARARLMRIPLDDGRTLWLIRPSRRPAGGPGGPPGGPSRPDLPPGFDGPRGARDGPPPGGGFGPPSAAELWAPPWARGTGLLLVLVLLFMAIAAGAFPVVRRLTRRLEALKQGVEGFGAGDLGRRVDARGRDEVAAVAASFNQAAERIEQLVRSNQSLLANASHELRSPLARLRMALSLIDEAPAERRAALRREIEHNIDELDALVEEVLLASRLDAAPRPTAEEAADRLPVDLLAVAAEEAAHSGADLQTEGTVPPPVPGDERLLRRAVRNLLENARRYGGDEVTVTLSATPAEVSVRVCDRGPGVPEAMRERIFEPFFRLPGHAEREGGVGLGLSLVRQIAARHRGRVHCEPREGGGSCFVLTLPAV